MKNLATVLLSATAAVGMLAGCQSIPDNTAANTSTHQASVRHTITPKLLQTYNWKLIDAKINMANDKQIAPLFNNSAKPLILNFMTDDNASRVALMNTCNNISAEYAVQNGTVLLREGMATMRACSAAQAQFDKAAMGVVQGNYSISKRGSHAPILTVRSPNHVAHFQAIAK